MKFVLEGGSGPLTVALDALQPRAEIPARRFLRHDQLFFVHKGQGRAVVEGRKTQLLPGTVVSVPREAWHELKNTGTGALQLVWVAWPAGLEAYHRELAALGPQASASARQALEQQHGIEWRSQPAQRAQPAQPAQSGQPGRRRRRHRGGRGRRRGNAPAAQAPPGPTRAGAGQPKATPPPARSPKPSAAPARGKPPRGRYGRRVKEVYMGGRWVKVTGEGPVIAQETSTAPPPDDDA